MFAHEYALLNLGLLDSTLLTHIVYALSVLRGDHTFVLHFLHLLLYALIISLLELHYLLGTLPRLLNLLPRLHLFLLEEGDTVGEKLGVPLHVLTFLLGDESCFATGARLRSTTLLVTKGVLGLNDVLVHA